MVNIKFVILYLKISAESIRMLFFKVIYWIIYYILIKVNNYNIYILVINSKENLNY